MPGAFEVYPDPWGKWQFRLRATDGRVVALNAFGRHPFDTSADARRGCEQVQLAVADARIEEV